MERHTHQPLAMWEWDSSGVTCWIITIKISVQRNLNAHYQTFIYSLSWTWQLDRINMDYCEPETEKLYAKLLSWTCLDSSQNNLLSCTLAAWTCLKQSNTWIILFELFASNDHMTWIQYCGIHLHTPAVHCLNWIQYICLHQQYTCSEFASNDHMKWM